MDQVESLPLRERKQLRTREAIRAAAMELFAVHGYEAVTVSDIAERAEIGRRTFFRYFPDKEDVLFADTEELHVLLRAAISSAAKDLRPLGGSLAKTLMASRAGVLALADAAAHRALHSPSTVQLIAASPRLQECALSRERAYVDTAIDTLLSLGADVSTATLAAHLAAGCYAAAHAETRQRPASLPEAAAKAFERLGDLHM